TLLRSVAKAGFGARMNLALFLPNWVGDAVMATPAVRALRRAYPAARVTGVLRPNVADVLAGAGGLDDTLFLGSTSPRAPRRGAVPVGGGRGVAPAAHRPGGAVSHLVPRGPGRLARAVPAARRLRPLRPWAVAHRPAAAAPRPRRAVRGQPGSRRLQPARLLG